MSNLTEGKRVFNWRSRSCFWSTGTNEEMDFGLVDPQTKKWLIRISILWTIQDGHLKAIVRSPLFDWSQSVQFKDLATKLSGLTKSPATLEAFRVALILAASGYADETEYESARNESEIRQELYEAEERVEWLKNMLSCGYFLH